MTPLITVNHPEYPSAHAFWTNALTDALAAYFCQDDMPWILTTSQDAVPQLVKPRRGYRSFGHIARELEHARVWSGLHWRGSMKAGAKLGSNVARHVLRHFGQDCNR